MKKLTNEQRKYFGLEPICNTWEKVYLKSKQSPGSILFFEKDIIKKQITTTSEVYIEKEYNEKTLDRTILLPKTPKGKEQKISSATLNSRKTIGISLEIDTSPEKYGYFCLKNENADVDFHSYFFYKNQEIKTVNQMIVEFIEESPVNHLQEIEKFKNKLKKRVKFKAGDYFCFKLNRYEYGFGRIILDLYKLKKSQLLPANHGLTHYFLRPVLVETLLYSSNSKDIPEDTLLKQSSLPSSIIFDRYLINNQYEIIGHKAVNKEYSNFPINFFEEDGCVFLQWGTIQREMTKNEFQKKTSLKFNDELTKYDFMFLSSANVPLYGSDVILEALNSDKDNYWASSRDDLRNPKFKHIKDKLFMIFGLDPNKSHSENAKDLNVILISELNSKLK